MNIQDNEENKPAEEETFAEAAAPAGDQPSPSTLESQLAAAERVAADNLAGWQRAKADFLNYKKEQEKMLADFRRYANEDIILSLLPTVDSFDLAAQHLPEELRNSDWAKGILCIKGMFENFLRDSGVIEIQTVGEKFDPQLSEAVGEEESDLPEDTVTAQLQKGYRMGEKVIRVAKVKVAKSKT